MFGQALGLSKIAAEHLGDARAWDTTALRDFRHHPNATQKA